jgi:hypothetical protein
MAGVEVGASVRALWAWAFSDLLENVSPGRVAEFIVAHLLQDGLTAAGMACVTRTEHVPPGKLAEPHIDHICVAEAWAQRSRVVEAWPGMIDGVRLSDHSAIVVEIERGSN